MAIQRLLRSFILLNPESLLSAEFGERSVTEYIAGTYAGLSAAYLGDMDTAFRYLEKAYDDHDPILRQLKYAPYVPAALKMSRVFKTYQIELAFEIIFL